MRAWGESPLPPPRGRGQRGQGVLGAGLQGAQCLSGREVIQAKGRRDRVASVAGLMAPLHPACGEDALEGGPRALLSSGLVSQLGLGDAVILGHGAMRRGSECK